MIALERLIMLAADELEDAEAASVEEHVLACGTCARKLEVLLEMRTTLVDVVRRGDAQIPVTPALVDALEAAGLVSRSYLLRPGVPVPCSVGADDVYALTTVQADLADVERVDVLVTLPFGVRRMEDVPFDAKKGFVAYVARSSDLRRLPSTRVVIELRTHGAGRERTLAPYFLDHTAYEP